MTEAVRYEVVGGAATITLDRPDTKNRLDAEGMAAIVSSLEAAAADDAVRVVVLTGTGTTFCAGADISQAAAGTPGGFAGSGPSAFVAVLTALLDYPKPTVARVQGHVAGGGNGLVAACDIAVASEDARFAFSEVRLGVVPAVVAVACLEVMPARHLRELLLTGERVDAQRALTAGLLTQVVEARGLDAAVDRYVEALVSGGPKALAGTKELLRTLRGLNRADAFAEAARVSMAAFTSDEGREGMTAYLERRPPAWTVTPG